MVPDNRSKARNVACCRSPQSEPDLDEQEVEDVDCGRSYPRRTRPMAMPSEWRHSECMPFAQITARSRTGRPVPCGGKVWGRDVSSVEAAPRTLLDLWERRHDLIVEWPADWIAPDGSQPGKVVKRQLAVSVSTPTVALQCPPEILDTATRLQASAPPLQRPPKPAEAPLDDTGLPPIEPTRSPYEEKPPPPVKTAQYTPKNARLHATLSGHLSDILDNLGAKNAKTPGEAELAGDVTLERIVDSLTAEKAISLRMSRPQRALCRAASGQSIGGLLTKAQEAFHFGTVGLTFTRPKIVWLRCGIRAGKTLVAAMAMIWCALTCSARRPPTDAEKEAGVIVGTDGCVPILQPGEAIRVVFVTPDLKMGRTAYNYVAQAFEKSPRLRKFIVMRRAYQMLVRRPCDGIHVLFETVAASPMGNNVRSGWLAGALFDEAAFFDDGDESVVNLRDNVTAATTRLLPGAQVWLPSSPWADAGYFHEQHTKAFGNPGKAIAFHSSSIAMNPALDVADIETKRTEDELLAAREYDAIPLSALSNLFFTPAVLACCVAAERTEENGNLTLPPMPGHSHYAGTDLGFRKNSSTLAIARNVQRETDGVPVDVAQLAYHEERIPPQGTPLVPGDVLKGFGAVCQEYRCLAMRGDNSDTPTADEHLTSLPGSPVAYDEYIPTQERNAALFDRVRQHMSSGRVELPNDPRLLGQLKRVTARPIPGGKTQIVLPKQGRAHGDLVVALAHAIDQCITGASRVSLYDSSYDKSIYSVDIRGYGSVREAKRWGSNDEED